MNTPPVPSIGKIIFRRSTVRGTPHIMNPSTPGRGAVKFWLTPPKNSNKQQN